MEQGFELNMQLLQFTSERNGNVNAYKCFSFPIIFREIKQLQTKLRDCLESSGHRNLMFANLLRQHEAHTRP